MLPVLSLLVLFLSKRICLCTALHLVGAKATLRRRLIQQHRNARIFPGLSWDWGAGKDEVTGISMVRRMGQRSDTWEELGRKRPKSDD